jgi:hypothetical protein
MNVRNGMKNNAYTPSKTSAPRPTAPVRSGSGNAPSVYVPSKSAPAPAPSPKRS